MIDKIREHEDDKYFQDEKVIMEYCYNCKYNIKLHKHPHNKIEELKGMLTGDLFQDGDLMMEIYNLKKQLNPEIETNPEADDDENDCLFCGS